MGNVTTKTPRKSKSTLFDATATIHKRPRIKIAIHHQNSLSDMKSFTELSPREDSTLDEPSTATEQQLDCLLSPQDPPQRPRRPSLWSIRPSLYKSQTDQTTPPPLPGSSMTKSMVDLPSTSTKPMDMWPMTSDQMDRMDVMHYFLRGVLKTNYFAQLTRLKPLKFIVDVGTGTGVWLLVRIVTFNNNCVVGNGS